MSGDWRVLEPGDVVMAPPSDRCACEHFAVVVSVDAVAALVEWVEVIRHPAGELRRDITEAFPRRALIIVHKRSDAA